MEIRMKILYLISSFINLVSKDGKKYLISPLHALQRNYSPIDSLSYTIFTAEEQSDKINNVVPISYVVDRDVMNFCITSGILTV